MATRTAPAVGALTMTKSAASLHLIDASGDLHAESVYAAGDGLGDLAAIEALAADYQPATQASLWKVTQTLEWEGDADPDNADVGQRNSVKDGINLLFKNITLAQSQTPRVIAPVAAIMQGNQDIPLLSDAILTALITEYLANALSGYSLNSAQYTERRERQNNPRIK
jgi:hypothetical protein